MDIGDRRPFNPWLSIWTKPRETIQEIVASNPTHMVVLLAALSGVQNALSRAEYRSLGDAYELPMIFGIAAIAGPVGGLIGLYLGGLLVRWTGKWIGGTASPQQIRAALAWATVPMAWTIVLWIPEVALFGDELFKSETPRMDGSLVLSLSYLVFALVELAIGIWAFVLLLKCLGQVQGFSAWRALANLVLSTLIIVIPLMMVLAVSTLDLHL